MAHTKQSGLAAHYFHHNKSLYYFISFSMPNALIKAYLLDATWNGGTLILRGVTKGESIPQFIKKHLLPLLKYQGDHARVMIDPNLFEMYNINSVPTMLMTSKTNDQTHCNIVSTIIPHTHITYQRCKAIDPHYYWKISGNVSTLWALNRLGMAGAPTTVFTERMKLKKTSFTQHEIPIVTTIQPKSLPETQIKNQHAVNP